MNFKKKWGTAIGAKFAPLYSILFTAELGEEIPNIKESDLNINCIYGGGTLTI